MKNSIKGLLALVLVATSVAAYAGPNYRYGGGGNHTSLGLRGGWIGGPNGITVRRTVGSAAAFEFIAGYSPKYARRSELPAIKKGNSFVGVSFAPYFLMSEGNLGVALTLDFGLRLNYHHYRYFDYPEWGPKITPEATAGAGIQLEFSERVELFADLHLKYFNDPHNTYVAGIESGMGIRFVLN